MKITGKGIPTRKTVGAIGDIYTDTLTGVNYECTFAYSPNGVDGYDYEWKPTDTVIGVDISNGPDMASVKEVIKKVAPKKQDIEEKKEKEVTENRNESKPEKNDPKKQTSKNHVNYAKAFDDNKKETK